MQQRKRPAIAIDFRSTDDVEPDGLIEPHRFWVLLVDIDAQRPFETPGVLDQHAPAAAATMFRQQEHRFDFAAVESHKPDRRAIAFQHIQLERRQRSIAHQRQEFLNVA
jgi:hypothetical protein